MPLRKESLRLLLVDMVLVLLAWWAAFWLRFNLDIPPEFEALATQTAGWVVPCFALGLLTARVYRHVWSYVGLPELRQLGAGVLLGGLITVAVLLVLQPLETMIDRRFGKGKPEEAVAEPQLEWARHADFHAATESHCAVGVLSRPALVWLGADAGRAGDEEVVNDIERRVANGFVASGGHVAGRRLFVVNVLCGG